MTLLAIDPGTTESAYVYVYDEGVYQFAKVTNDAMMDVVRRTAADEMVIEMIASYGMPVGAEVFETCVWIGRFLEASRVERVERIFRREVKLHLCGNARAKDANIRQALLDRFGGKAAAIGTKAKPGRLYGMSGDVWAALAVAVTWLDTRGARAA